MTPTADQTASYLWFIRNIMGISTAALPDNSGYITYSLTIGLSYVNPAIACVDSLLYQVALNNFAGDWLINYAPDQAGQTFFVTARQDYGINDFIAGVVSGSGDQGTSDTLLVPDAFKNFTLQNLQSLKTPYGREYLAIAQDYGPNIWGVA